MKKHKLLLGILTGVFLILFVLVGLMTLLEYNPPAIDEINIASREKEFEVDGFSVLIYNIGYGGLGKDADFFMDGGSAVLAESKEKVHENLSGIVKEVKENPADFYLFQEVDLPSKRSYRVDQKAFLEENLGLKGHFVANYKAAYVPYPWPTIGKVHSGLLSLSEYKLLRSYRMSLPGSFSWPVSTVNLKRCLLVEEFPIKGSDKKLVLMNLHLEAYDSGEGKLLQSKALLELAEGYYADGHYVLAGGDWNQLFPGSEKFKIQSKEYWTPGHLSQEELPKGWTYLSDASVASCRSLHAPLGGKDHQMYLIDGYLASPNLSLESIKTIDLGFTHSDHHPVLVKLKLK